MTSAKPKTCVVVGSGSWGTALASLLDHNGHDAILLGRDPSVMAKVASDRENTRYLPGHALSDSLTITADSSVLNRADIILLVIPTSQFRNYCEQLAQRSLSKTAVIISCSKGIERKSGERMSEIVSELLPENPLAVLSGPNHAEEVSSKLATCAVIGASEEALAVSLQKIFSNGYFRCYTQTDLPSIELGGAIKNVFAIAAGIAEGLGLGDNASAALVTRGLAEMIRLGMAMGGKLETFIGLSGIGDLVATCYSHHSRNNRVGRLIGTGKTTEEAVASLGMVAEGVPNTLSIYEAARRCNVQTPLIDAVYGILYEENCPRQTLHQLLTRDHKRETE